MPGFSDSHWFRQAFGSTVYGFCPHREIDLLRSDVLNAINKGYPIVANIAGTAVDTDGSQHSYGGGHYLTVVGYSDSGRTVKIADPADANGRGWYLMATERLAHWTATRGYSA